MGACFLRGLAAVESVCVCVVVVVVVGEGVGGGETYEGKTERSPMLQSIICNLIMHAKICEVKIYTLNTRKSGKQAHSSIINPIALRMAKTP